MITFKTDYGNIEISEKKGEIVVNYEGTEVTRFEKANGLYMLEAVKFTEKVLNPVLKHFDENIAHEECPDCDNCDDKMGEPEYDESRT